MSGWEEALSDALLGARLESVSITPATGLFAMMFYLREKRFLAIGLGPKVHGVGWISAMPRHRAAASHGLIAALRAHAVDHRVRSVQLDEEGTLWLSLGTEGAISRVEIALGENASVVVHGPADSTRFGFTPEPSRAPRSLLTLGPSIVLEQGEPLLAKSERFAEDALRTAFARALKKRADELLRRADAVQGDLKRLDDVGRLQKLGRLLLAQGAKIPKGATRAVLDDWEEGGTVEITLDPARPAKSQADVFFAKARRYQRGEAVMRKRLDATLAQWEAVEELRSRFEASGATAAAIETLSKEAALLGVRVHDDPVLQRAGVGTGQAARKERLPFQRYRVSEQRMVLVGRGGRDNDELLTHYARPHDLWLHAKNIHGAHVIVPLEKGQSCPSEVLVDAATLAAHHSDARGESTVEVSYVERRHVRKPRGSAPGAVRFDHEKVLVLRVEADRLTRLLDARDESVKATFKP